VDADERTVSVILCRAYDIVGGALAALAILAAVAGDTRWAAMFALLAAVAFMARSTAARRPKP
jgi:hypothetical protein